MASLTLSLPARNDAASTAARWGCSGAGVDERALMNFSTEIFDQ